MSKVINLNKQFKPINGDEINYESFIFSGGEPHIKILTPLSSTDSVSVTHRINSFVDMGLLCVTVNALKIMNVTLDTLFIPYFPAARQDRIMSKGESLSVKVYADIINNFNFKKVMIYDVHSDVTPALVHNCESISNHKFVKRVIENISSKIVLISPDGGALKKAYKLSEYLGGIEVIECSKSRNVSTGMLAGFKVYTDNLNGADCILVDDICDGGGTFIGLAKELKAKNSGNLYLAVSHGIFSKGFDELDKFFSKIYTTDSVRELSHSNLVQLNLLDVI